MPANPTLTRLPHRWTDVALHTGKSWWFMLQFGAVVLVLSLQSATHTKAYRAITARHLYSHTWKVLPWFTTLSSLLSLVLIRIVVVTALSYGLSQYALQMVIRVLVLELIPLSAALFVALRAGLAFNAGMTGKGTSDCVRQVPDLSLQQLRTELVPRVLAEAFSVLALAVFSCLIALVLTYLVVYGLSPWGLAGFTRTVGQVFDLAVCVGLVLKVLLFSLAVAVVPLAASLENTQTNGISTLQPGAVRLFVVLLVIETGSLIVNYI